MKRIEDTICEAIELIVNKAVDNASYDKTVQGIIKSCVDEATGKYLIQYQDSTFYAYSSNLDYTYSNGVSVYVLVPGNDMSDNKTIIGTVDNLGIDYINQASKEDLFNKIGASCINNSEGTFDLSSYREHNSPTEETKTRYIEVLYDADAEYPENNRLDINEEFADLYLVDASSILCSGFFKTNFDLYQKNQGNYGIIFGIDFYDNASEEGEVANPSIVTRYYFIDVDNMEGNPYELTSGKRQYNIFDIDGENFYRISSISVFTEGFPNHKSDIEIEEQELYDISISDIELYAVEQMSEEEIASCGVSILTPQGTFFGANSANTSLTLKAQVKVKGKLINSDNLSFYWFKENLAVNASNYKYNQYGGRGWECLNPYNIIVEGDDEVSRQIEWVPAKNTYEVNLSLVNARKTNFKCVVIYNDVAYNKIVAIENRKSGVPTITIESDSGTQFYYNVGRPNLTCKINGNEEVSYTYVWAKQDAYGNVTILPEDSTKNNTDYSNYSNAVSALETLNASIAAGDAHKNASAATIASLENTINSYKYTQMVHQNKLLKVAINEITNFAIFKCSVYNGGTYLGTTSITLSNSLQIERNYSLVINEGNQTYQYNEYGVSPASKSLEKYITIPALTFTVYDSNGKPLSEEALRECGVAWKVPSSRSMLVSINAGDAQTETDEEGYTYYYDVNTISYKIRDKFYYDYKNNDIELFVDYKDQELVAKTNLAFIKQGDDGTNGTSYSCKIVPNTENYFESYPTFTTLSNGTSGTFNFGDFVLNNIDYSDTAPFVVKLYKSGEEIFSDSESGTTNKTDTGEDIDILVQWGMLANTYDTTNYDLSDFDINSADGHMKFTNAANNASRIGANSIKCTVNFTDIDGRLNVLYATLPINVIRISDTDYRITLNDNTGFRYAVYSSDGTNPKYDDTKPFELTVYKTINNIEEEISDLTNSNLYYVWDVEGDYYDFYTTNGTYIDSENLIYQNFRINSNQGRVKPAPSYNGLCVNNRVYCEVHTNSTSGPLVGRIDIPVNLFLNRYGFAHLNAWDGNSIQLNEEGGFILAPQIGAGKKENDNSFTGVLMGEVRDPNKEKSETGLFGYTKGERSFFLDAETGNAYFRGTISNGDKDSLESTGSGVFFDKDGDFSVGDDSQYIKWIDDELSIQAKSFTISISDSETKDIQQIASEADAASTRATAAEALALSANENASNALSKVQAKYANCSTQGNTAAKVATITPTVSNWSLFNGAEIFVKFTKANTATNPTLKVDATDAKLIKNSDGGDLTSTFYWKDNSLVHFVYDGTNWRMLDIVTTEKYNTLVSNIDGISQAVGTKASQTDLTNLTTRVTTNETNISQTATSITSLVSNQDTYTAPDGTTKTNTIKSAIKQNADNISLRVEKNGVIAAINASTESDGGSAVKISADKVNIEGAAIFTGNGRLSQTSLNNSYDTKGAAATAESNAVSTAAADATSKANAAQSAAITAAADDATSKANAVNNALEAYKTSTNSTLSSLQNQVDTSAVARTQRIYYRSSAVSSGVPIKPNGSGLPTTWVTEEGNKWNSDATTASGWSRKVTSISNGTGENVTKYLYLWTATQKQMVDGTVAALTASDIALDDSTTVIDGGNIITGTVTAQQLNATNINASGSLSIGALDSAANTAINKGVSALSKVEYYNRFCTVMNTSNTQTNYWRKFASYSETAANSDPYIIFDVMATGDFISSKKFGRLKAHLRTGSTKGSVTTTQTNLDWINRAEGIDLNDFVLAYKATSGTKVDIELWARCSASWFGYVFNMVSEGSRTEVSAIPKWTLYDSKTANGEADITSGFTRITSIDIDSARTTATSYITHINDQGIYISPSGVSPTVLSDPGNSVKIDGTGMEVYKGGTSVASYGDSARIGTEDGSAFHINSDSLEAYYIDESNNRNRYLYVTPEGITYGTIVVASTEDINKTLDGYWDVDVVSATISAATVDENELDNTVFVNTNTFINRVTTTDSDGDAVVDESLKTFNYNGSTWSPTLNDYGITLNSELALRSGDKFVLQAVFTKGLSRKFEDMVDGLDGELSAKITGNQEEIGKLSNNLGGSVSNLTRNVEKVNGELTKLNNNVNNLTSDYEILKKGIVVDTATPKLSVYTVQEKGSGSGEYTTVTNNRIDITSSAVDVVVDNNAVASMYGDTNEDGIAGAMRADHMITKYVYFRSDGTNNNRTGNLALVGRTNGHLSLKLI